LEAFFWPPVIDPQYFFSPGGSPNTFEEQGSTIGQLGDEHFFKPCSPMIQTVLGKHIYQSAHPPTLSAVDGCDWV